MPKTIPKTARRPEIPDLDSLPKAELIALVRKLRKLAQKQDVELSRLRMLIKSQHPEVSPIARTLGDMYLSGDPAAMTELNDLIELKKSDRLARP